MHTDFLFEMMQAAKDAHVRGSGRVTYTPKQKIMAVLFYLECKERLLSRNDAAHLMSMHSSTLKGWVEAWDQMPDQIQDQAFEDAEKGLCCCCCRCKSPG